MSRTALICCCLFALTLVTLSRAQDDPPFQPSVGRYAPGDAGPDWVATLDTWTGWVHLAPAGDALGGPAIAVDMTTGRMLQRKLGRDVSAGHVLPHGLPVAGRGAGRPVFAWAGSEAARIAVLDTRSGVHLALEGAPGPDAQHVTTNLRQLARSVRQVRTKGE